MAGGDEHDLAIIKLPETPIEGRSGSAELTPGHLEKMRHDSSGPAPADVPLTQIHTMGFPHAEIAHDGPETRPSVSDPSKTFADNIYHRLNEPKETPVPLSQSEQAIADHLVSVIKAVRTIEQRMEKGEHMPLGANNAGRQELTNIVEKMDPATLNKILPSVNEQLEKSGLNPGVKLATAIDDERKRGDALYLGVEVQGSPQAESGKLYSKNYRVGRVGEN